MKTNQDIDAGIDTQIETLRTEMPDWINETIELAEHAANAERAAAQLNPGVLERSKNFIVEVAQWQEKLSGWQVETAGRRAAEFRILKATLDATMDEANTAAHVLGIR